MYAKIMKGSYGKPCEKCGKVHTDACSAEMEHVGKEGELVEKANPYHGADGRFSTKDKATFTSTGPKFRKHNDRAREKARAGGGGGGSGPSQKDFDEGIEALDFVARDGEHTKIKGNTLSWDDMGYNLSSRNKRMTTFRREGLLSDAQKGGWKMDSAGSRKVGGGGEIFEYKLSRNGYELSVSGTSGPKNADNATFVRVAPKKPAKKSETGYWKQTLGF